MPENRFLSTCVLLLLLSVSVGAQSKISWLRGELVGGSALDSHMADYQVELSTSGDHLHAEREHVNSNGGFAFRDLEPGTYRFRVLTMHGDSVHEEWINVHDGMQLSIHLNA